MRRSDKLLTLLFLIIFSINFISAGLSQLGIFKQGECINLLQTCADCSYNTITSVVRPDSSQALGLTTMEKIGFVYNLTFCNTSSVGTYAVNGFGDLGGIDTIWNYEFIITNSGKEFNLGEIIVYMVFLLIFLGMVYYSSKLVTKDNPQTSTNQQLYEMKKRNEFQYYVSVLKTKMWIVGLFGIYIFLLLFLVLSNQLVYNLGFMDLNDILSNIIIVVAWGLVPFVLFWLAYLILIFYKSTADMLQYQFGGFRQQQ